MTPDMSDSWTNLILESENLKSSSPKSFMSNRGANQIEIDKRGFYLLQFSPPRCDVFLELSARRRTSEFYRATALPSSCAGSRLMRNTLPVAPVQRFVMPRSFR